MDCLLDAESADALHERHAASCAGREIGHTSMVEQSAEQHTGLLPLSGMDHITERDMAKHANDKQFIHDKAEAKTTHLARPPP